MKFEKVLKLNEFVSLYEGNRTMTKYVDVSTEALLKSILTREELKELVGNNIDIIRTEWDDPDFSFDDGEDLGDIFNFTVEVEYTVEDSHYSAYYEPMGSGGDPAEHDLDSIEVYVNYIEDGIITQILEASPRKDLVDKFYKNLDYYLEDHGEYLWSEGELED